MTKPPFVLPLKTAPSPFPGRLDIFDATDSWYVEFKEDVATAIVTACNSHEELVAALRAVLVEWDSGRIASTSHDIVEAIDLARLALAKAGARP